MRVNHQHLRVFHVVALEGSISRAARRLGVSQPTLSQQLRTLELRHRVALFDGRRQPLQLTEAGRRLFAITGRLFAIADEVENFLDGVSGGEAVAVRLGSDSPVYAARLVAAFAEHNPGAGVSVRIGNAEEVVDWLRDGRLDAAIGSDPPFDDFFFYLPIYRDSLALAAPQQHPLAECSIVALEDLACETQLVREPTSRTRRASERLLEHAGIVPRRIIEFHTREAIREAIALGLGVSFFYSAECPPDPRVCYRPISFEAETPTFMGYLICQAEQRRAPLLKSLFAAAENLAQHSPLPL